MWRKPSHEPRYVVMSVSICYLGKLMLTYHVAFVGEGLAVMI